MPPLPTYRAPSQPPRTYRELMERLDSQGNIDALWAHQDEALGRYDDLTSQGKTDVAISLPTGQGKTLVGLLVGRMHMLRTGRKALYFCPTKQLVQQVVNEAQELGLPAVDISGSWKPDAEPDNRVNPDARAAYLNKKAIGVATYSSIFNYNPTRIDTADLLVFDDAHAAAQDVISPWQLELSLQKHANLVQKILAYLSRHLPRGFTHTAGPNPPPGSRDPQLVPHRVWIKVANEVQQTLQAAASGEELGEAWFAWRLIASKLERCFCFLSPGTITIRPWIPPIHDNPLFAASSQRLYLSATFDRYGHLEHVFGVPNVEFVTGAHRTHEPGRRLIIDGDDAISATNDLERIRRLLAVCKKTLVLVPSTKRRDSIIEYLERKKAGGLILGQNPRNLDEDLDSLRDADHATLVLANRYDGINLGKGVCRHIILVDNPTAVGVQETFTTRTWNLLRAADARARERILQGMGRCTRNPRDWCLISLVGADLLQFLRREDIEQSIPPRIQSEILLGKETVDANREDPRELLRTLKTFVDDAEPGWRELGQQFSDEQAPEGNTELQEQLKRFNRNEAKFGQHLWRGKDGAAREVATKTAEDIQRHGLRPESAAWYYLASVGAELERHGSGPDASTATADGLMRQAYHHGDREWYGSLEPLFSPVSTAPDNASQVKNLVAFVRRSRFPSPKLRDRMDEALEGILHENPARVHAALRFLGESLGLKVILEDGKGHPDNIWHLNGVVRFNWEAKTKKETSFLSISDVRQVRAQVEEVANNFELEMPADLRTTCITNCVEVDEWKEKERDEFTVTSPEAVHRFMQQWFETMRSIYGQGLASNQELQRLLVEAMRTHSAQLNQLPHALGVRSGGEVLKPRSVA